MGNCKLCNKKFWLFFREYKEGFCKNCYLEHLKNEKIKRVNSIVIRSSSKIFNDFIVLDFETTGFDNINDKIIEIAAIKYKNRKSVDEFYTLVNPEVHIPHKITKLTGINDNKVKNKPTIDKCMGKLIDFIGELPIVAHNADFDVKFLLANACYSINSVKSKYKIDTVKLSREMFKDLPNHKLPTIKNYLNLDIESHRASSDCKVCAEIYLKYCNLKEQKLIEEQKLKEKMYSKCVINPDECLDVITDILSKNNRSLELIKTGFTGNYFDIKMFFNFLRLKLNGKKHYMILDIPKEKFASNYQNEKIEDTCKSETGKSRIYISSTNDLYKFDKLILKQFDNTMNNLKDLKKYNDKFDEYLDEYLSNE